MAWFGKDFSPYGPIGYNQSSPRASSSNPTFSANLANRTDTDDDTMQIDRSSDPNDDSMQIDPTDDNDHASTVSLDPHPPTHSRPPPQTEVHQFDTASSIPSSSSSAHRTGSVSKLTGSDLWNYLDKFSHPRAAQVRADFFRQVRQARIKAIATRRASCRGIKLEFQQDEGHRLAEKTFTALRKFWRFQIQENESGASEGVDDFDDSAQQYQEGSAEVEGSYSGNVTGGTRFDWSMLHFCKQFKYAPAPRTPQPTPTSSTAYESSGFPQVPFTKGTSDYLGDHTGMSAADDPDSQLTPYQTHSPPSRMASWTPTPLYANTNQQVHPESSVDVSAAQGSEGQLYWRNTGVSFMTPNYSRASVIDLGE